MDLLKILEFLNTNFRYDDEQEYRSYLRRLIYYIVAIIIVIVIAGLLGWGADQVLKHF